MNDFSKKQIFFLALVFLIGLLTLNFVVRQVTQSKLLDNSESEFDETALHIQRLVDKRIDRYVDLVNFGRKFFESSEQVNRDEFTQFFSDYFTRRKEALSGVENIAFVEHVSNKQDFITRVRSEKTNTPYKFLYFTVSSEDPGNSHYVFNYLYPHPDSSRFFGYDVSDSQELERTFRLAASEGQPKLSNAVTLFGKEYLVLVEPIYNRNPKPNSTREEAVYGFIALTLKKDQIFDNIYEYMTEESNRLNRKVSFIDNPAYTFYEDINITDDVLHKEPLISKTHETTFLHRKIGVTVESKRTLQLTLFERYFPDINFIVSSVVAVLFFIIMAMFRVRCETE